MEFQPLSTNPSSPTQNENNPPRQETRIQRLNRVRRRIDEIIHDRIVEYIVIALVVTDAVIVLFELMIDLKAFGEKLKHSVLPEALHITSIVILSIFLVEVFIKIFALGPRFFKSPMNVIDGIIVIISFIMDILFMNNEEWHDAIGLLIILRLWRIVRIVNGIVQTVREQAEMKMEHKQKEIEELQERIKVLEEKLKKYEGSESENEGGEEVEVKETVEDRNEEVKVQIVVDSEENSATVAV